MTERCGHISKTHVAIILGLCLCVGAYCISIGPTALLVGNNTLSYVTWSRVYTPVLVVAERFGPLETSILTYVGWFDVSVQANVIARTEGRNIRNW